MLSNQLTEKQTVKNEIKLKKILYLTRKLSYEQLYYSTPQQVHKHLKTKTSSNNCYLAVVEYALKERKMKLTGEHSCTMIFYFKIGLD